jgi:hypothetical protein
VTVEIVTLINWLGVPLTVTSWLDPWASVDATETTHSGEGAVVSVVVAVVVVVVVGAVAGGFAGGLGGLPSSFDGRWANVVVVDSSTLVGRLVVGAPIAWNGTVDVVDAGAEPVAKALNAAPAEPTGAVDRPRTQADAIKITRAATPAAVRTHFFGFICLAL